MTDPIADMLTIIRNGYSASKEEVRLPFSKLKMTLAKKLESLGYVEEVSQGEQDKKKVITVGLRYKKGKPEVQGIKRISKPGLRVYKNKSEISYVYGGLGAAIVSTNKGLLTDREARKKGLGGEIICEVW